MYFISNCIVPYLSLNCALSLSFPDVKKVIIGQVIGGVFWGVFSGQPLLIQLTTAPLAIYIKIKLEEKLAKGIKIIFYICDDFKLDFHAMYCAVGLWNSFFLVVYALFDVSRLMRWSTRSTEEIFALFISIAFCNDAFTAVRKNFKTNYYSPSCQPGPNSSYLAPPSPSAYAVTGNHSVSYVTYPPDPHMEDLEGSNVTITVVQSVCTRENSILYLLLMFGTLWLGVMLYNFNKTPYLNANKREVLADYALPVAVIVLSFIGSYVFRDVKRKSLLVLLLRMTVSACQSPPVIQAAIDTVFINYEHTPHHTTSHHTTSHHIILHYTTPYHTTPHHTTPYHTTPHHIIPHHTTPHHTTTHHTTLHHMYHITSHHTTPHHTTPHHTTPDQTRPEKTIPDHALTNAVFLTPPVEHFRYDNSYDMFQLPPLYVLPIPAVFATMGLGFSLSMLFFMDQNIGSAMVNNPCNK
ncbi:Sodium bicarbonate transporter-like protein 11 [Portunus trituberculatus]|uniref:Sodium bicarbonate transporter-like protein 11 n=1 Tax=Portunus trituberculatus TaxID=210409 RepID=A0A5B7E0P5_PORTR|nr:Sodium bicarbonate transporter-like protein 11 [Portunus trituberculatus]